jgi:Orsellinic acid/F9775 biosynthesis cluster protein D
VTIHAQNIIDVMERYIKYDMEFGLAICVTCKKGIPADHVLRHFRMHHNPTWKEHKKGLTEYVSTLRLTPTDELHYPEEIREPVYGIEIKEGWCCGEDECTVCGISEKYIVNHCRNSHGQAAIQRKAWYQGRIQTLLGHPYIKYICQCTRLTDRYFVVEQEEASMTTQHRLRAGLD